MLTTNRPSTKISPFQFSAQEFGGRQGSQRNTDSKKELLRDPEPEGPNVEAV